MRRLALIFSLLCMALLAGSCNDDPKITFFSGTHTYQVGNDMTLTVTLDGVTITDTDAGAVFTSPDGKIGQLTLVKIIDGKPAMAVGGLVITTLDDGSGIAFEGQMAVSETEMMVIKGTISNGQMVLDIVTVPITQK